MSNGGDNRQLTVELDNEKLRKRIAELEARIVAQANEWRIAYNVLRAQKSPGDEPGPR